MSRFVFSLIFKVFLLCAFSITPSLAQRSNCDENVEFSGLGFFYDKKDDCSVTFKDKNGNSQVTVGSEQDKILSERYHECYMNKEANCDSLKYNDIVLPGTTDINNILSMSSKYHEEELQEENELYGEIATKYMSILNKQSSAEDKALITALCSNVKTGEDLQRCSLAETMIEERHKEGKGSSYGWGKHRYKEEINKCMSGPQESLESCLDSVADTYRSGAGLSNMGGGDSSELMDSVVKKVAEDKGDLNKYATEQIGDEYINSMIDAAAAGVQDDINKLKEDLQNATTIAQVRSLEKQINELENIKDKFEEAKGNNNAVDYIWQDENLKKYFQEAQQADNFYYSAFTTGNKNDIQYKFGMKSTYNEVLNNYKNNNSGCWFCSIFGKAFQAINNITTQIFNTLKEPLLPLLSVGLALWIVFLVLRFFSSFQGMDPGQFFGLFSKGIFKGFIATVLLTAGPSFIFGYTLTPVLELGGAFSQKIIESDTDFNTYKDSELGSFDPCSEHTLDSSAFPEGSAFSYTAFNQLDCMMRTTSWRVINGLAVGASIVSLVFKEANIFSFFSMFDILLMGCLIWLGHFVMLIVLPLKLIDILAHIAFVGALMPLLIITWVFQEWKNSYAKRALEIFVGACFTFIMLSLLLILSLRIITFAIPTDENCQNATPGMMACPNTENGKQGLLTVLKNGEDVEDLKNEVDFTGMQIFITLGACFFAWKLLDSASDLAEELTGFSSPGTELSSAANKPLMAGVAVAGGAAGTIGASLGRLGKDSIKNAWQNRKITKSRYASPTQSGKSSGVGSSPTPQPTAGSGQTPKGTPVTLVQKQNQNNFGVLVFNAKNGRQVLDESNGVRDNFMENFYKKQYQLKGNIPKDGNTMNIFVDKNGKATAFGNDMMVIKNDSGDFELVKKP